MKINRELVEQHILSICPKIDRSDWKWVCPYCGMYMLPHQRFCLEHILTHYDVMQAKDKYGFYYKFEEQERMKHPLRKLVADTSKPYLVREKALIKILKCYFSRCVTVNGIENCPSFKDYIAMTLYNNGDNFFPCRELKEDDELWINMVNRYGTKPGLEPGASYTFKMCRNI